MFRRLPETGVEPVRLMIDGSPVEGRADDSVATVLLATGHAACRTSAVSGEPRGPYCMMGVCFECLVEIDGVPNRQACLVAVAQGMNVRTGSSLRKIPS